MSATCPHPIRTRPAAGADLGSDVPPLLQRIFRARGIQSADELALDLSRLPGPSPLQGIDAAVAILTHALQNDHKVLIVGDFDADGATSTALGVLGLRALGFEHVDFLVPNRFEYGYGLTPEIVALATQRGARIPDLIVTVDNGIASVAGVAAANAAGIRVLITDHHLPGRELPAAAAIVNPNQLGCEFPGKHLAGVGVMFYVLLALRAQLRAAGRFAARAEPNLATWLDLVALGTVADMVPLDAINRTLVHQGMARIRAGHLRPGMQALLDIAGRERSRLVAADLGFVVAPRLNAAGRLDDMTIGIQCLLAEDAGRARELAAQLDELNRDRRAIQADMQREALAAVAALALDQRNLPWGLCLFDPAWHQGVVGLVAGRVKDSLHRPVIAFAPANGDLGDGAELKGSARSIPGLHIRDALEAIATREPHLLNRFGGHALAAGLSLRRDQLPAFRAAFDAEVRRRLTPADLAAEIWTDGELAATEVSIDSARLLRAAGPWGQRFPEPSFHGEFRVLGQRWLGDPPKHLKLVVSIGADDGPQFDAIAFNVADRGWPEPLPARVQLVYRLDLNLFRGVEAVQLLIEHLLP